MDEAKECMKDEYKRANVPDPQQLKESVSHRPVSHSNIFLLSRQVHYTPSTINSNTNAEEPKATDAPSSSDSV